MAATDLNFGPPLHTYYTKSANTSIGSLTSSGKPASNMNGMRAAGHDLIDVNDILVHAQGDGSPYVIEEGAFANVLKGEWRGEPAALKEIKNQHIAHFHKTIDEVKFVRSCHQRNIVVLYGMCVTANGVLLVFELMEEDLFKALMTKGKEYTWYNRGRSIALDVAHGLAYLHSRNIVHCDIKSLNILLDKDGVAKIVDMGMAKLLQHTLVSKGSAMGSWAWAAPELLNNSRVDTKVDVYSFGVVLWEIVIGEKPVRGSMRKLRVPEECPQGVADIVKACMTVQPENRPTAEQLILMLEDCNKSLQ